MSLSSEDISISPLRRIWRLLPMTLRRRIGHKLENQRQKNIALKLPPISKFKNTKIKSVAIIGLISAPTGLGNAAQLLVNELKQNGINIVEVDCVKIFKFPDYLKQVQENSFKDVDAVIIAINPDIAINVLGKIGIKILAGKKVIGYWVWELETPPKQWGLMAKFVHEIWTPSEFSRQALKKIFNLDIKVVRHPVALFEPPKVEVNVRDKVRSKLGIKKDDFVAFQSIAFSSSLERKNTIEAIEIFLEAFKDINNAYFVVRYFGDEHYPKSLEILKRAAQKGNGKIKLVKSSMNKIELFDFYAASDLYISLHRSEGFGLNIAEAMLVGLPVMATNWSGSLELCKEDNCLLIDCAMIEVRDCEKIYYKTNALWAKPDREMAIAKLYEFYHNRELKNKISERAQKYIMDNFGATQLF